MTTPDFLGFLLGRQNLPEWIYAPRKGKRVKRYGELSAAGRERDIRRIQRANPELDRQSAARRAAASRRRGYIPESVRGQTSSQAQYEAYQRYQRSQEAAQRAAETRARISTQTIALVVRAYDAETGEPSAQSINMPASWYSQADRSRIARHWNAIGRFLDKGDYSGLARISRYGDRVTDKQNNIVYTLETDPALLETWGNLSTEIMPETIYQYVEPVGV